MRVAVVDVGTNSTRLLVAEVQEGRITQEVERTTTVTRLGAGVDASGRLAEDAMERVHTALAHYRETIDRLHTDHAVAVLTSAVRDAANGPEFTAAVRDRFDLDARTIDGEEEARLTYRGATSERDPADTTPLLVADIGGGSTEVIVGAAGESHFHASLQAGVVRQTERHLNADPPTRAELDELAQDVRGLIDADVPGTVRRAAELGIAVAGTPTSLAAIDLGLTVYDPQRVHGHVLDTATCEHLLDRLAALPLEQRKEVDGLHPDRAEMILAGTVILLELLRAFGLPRIGVSEHDILRGAALAAAELQAR